MYRNDAARSVGLEIAEVLDCNPPAASVEWPQVEVIELAVAADIGAFELPDFAGPHAGEDAYQEAPINMRLDEVAARLPYVDAIFAAGEQGQLQEGQQLVPKADN